jgi:hypothetical protein
MRVISKQQEDRDKRSLARVLLWLNFALLIVLFTVSYIQR